MTGVQAALKARSLIFDLREAVRRDDFESVQRIQAEVTAFVDEHADVLPSITDEEMARIRESEMKHADVMASVLDGVIARAFQGRHR